jgi:hypothetical protein
LNDEPSSEQEAAPPKRGEAAWKQAQERIAERNERARKAGRQDREANEHRFIEARRAADRRDMAAAIGKHRGR